MPSVRVEPLPFPSRVDGCLNQRSGRRTAAARWLLLGLQSAGSVKTRSPARSQVQLSRPTRRFHEDNAVLDRPRKLDEAQIEPLLDATCHIDTRSLARRAARGDYPEALVAVRNLVGAAAQHRNALLYGSTHRHILIAVSGRIGEHVIDALWATSRDQ